MKRSCLTVCLLFGIFFNTIAQNNASIREYQKAITTYPFSDPNPIPITTNIYPYFRFDGFTDKPVQKQWKIVELQNDYIKLTILPQIGGKIWSAIEKSTGKPFIYENHVVKFRDIAMRGPWTSGGIEANYGIIGHTPNSVTPVNYIARKNDDGSVSCIISVFDMLTRTTWTMEVNLPKDKAYFTTKSFWHNSNNIEEPYYHWMNVGIKTKGNLQYIYSGTNYLGHEGEYGDWPINKRNGKDVSLYEHNNFGGYKSYHVYGKYTDFFGAYWKDDDFGMARYSNHDDKAGKKIWIWGLSQQGMIWEKLLTDTDGQYSEIQSGRLFNQTAEKSTFTPFKHKNFSPGATDTWTEYWYPVIHTKGFVAANNYGALNITVEEGWLKIYFNPVQTIDDAIEIKQSEQVVYHKKVKLSPLQLFVDSVKADAIGNNITVTLGGTKLVYQSNPDANTLSRPIASPSGFDWNSAYGLYLQGKEYLDEKMYALAEAKLKSALDKEPNFIPALVNMAQLLYRNMRYNEALSFAKKALSINTNDGAANYYYGIINAQLGNMIDAKDGFDLASLSVEYRSAAYEQLSGIYLKEKNWDKASEYASKALDFNRYDITALQRKAIAMRYQHNDTEALVVLNTILSFDPLNHFARFEKYLLNPSEENKLQFTTLIRDEQPFEVYLELAANYYQLGCLAECEKILTLSPQNSLVNYWRAFIENKTGKQYSVTLANAKDLSPVFIFPFRFEDEEVLQWAIQQSNSWVPKCYLALLYRDRNRLEESKRLLIACANEPDLAPFYVARASTLNDGTDIVDLKRAITLDKQGWRYHKALAEYYVNHHEYSNALTAIEPFYKTHTDNYIIGMLYAKILLYNERYAQCDKLLSQINILPFEGATIGRELYRETKLMLAIEQMKAKNYTKALVLVNDAKKWPRNLGVGKPYQENTDERLENWMAYLCYQKIGESNQAIDALKMITQFVPKIENTVSNFMPANHLITALAMEKLSGRAVGEKWLNEQVNLYPDNKILSWCVDAFKNKQMSAGDNSDASVRIISKLPQ